MSSGGTILRTYTLYAGCHVCGGRCACVEQEFVVNRQAVSSSNLQSIGYDDARQLLEVEFTSGNVYCYYGVPSSLYQELMAARSHGQFFNAHIRDRYPFDQLQ